MCWIYGYTREFKGGENVSAFRKVWKGISVQKGMSGGGGVRPAGCGGPGLDPGPGGCSCCCACACCSCCNRSYLC